jgi:hypothetical protein
MNAFVHVHVKFLRKNFSADSALVAHGMLKKSSSLLPQAGEMDLADFDAIPCASAFTHASLTVEYFFLEKFEFMFLYLMKLESLLAGVGLPAARLAALVNLIKFSLFNY